MPASDPTPGVPTPTGTLQGVAAFAWDGTTWQPTAGAGPDVATPTGVLRGVAPFTWDGAAWQPAGRAQPGVAAPGGVLDGVAVYTWSGAAWTPAGGQPTPSTPSGALRGVAAFNWDGTAWQPAGRAGPSVATPYGVLDGVAMFNWTGTAWTPGPSLALNFMTPGSLDPRITFTRASTATYFDVTGTMQTAATNTPRWDYNPVTHVLRGLLLEEARTNAAVQTQDFTNAAWTKVACAITRPGTNAPDGTSLNLVTEDTSSSAHAFYGGSISYTAVRWTASVFVRAGTQRYISLRGEDLGGGNWPWITFDTQTQAINANASVSASGFAALPGGTYRIWLSWTATAVLGNIVVAGSNVATAPPIGSSLGTSYVGTSQTWYAWGAQAEIGAFPTSYIPTAAAAATRAADNCQIPPANMGWFVAPGGSWQAEFISIDPAPNNDRVVCLPSASNRAQMLINAANQAVQYDAVGSFGTTNALTTGVVAKAASTWASTLARVCLNAGSIATSTALTTGYPDNAAWGTGFMQYGVAGQGLNGYMRAMRYWPRILSDAEMQAVTT